MNIPRVTQRRQPPSEGMGTEGQSSSSFPLEVLPTRSQDHVPERRHQHIQIMTPSLEDLVVALPSRSVGAVLSNESPSNQLYLGQGEGMLMEQRVAKIVSELEKNVTLMEDNPFSEQLRLDTLREMTECLTLKRTIKRKLVKTVSQKSRYSPISFFKRMKYRISMSATKFNLAIENMLYSFELWYSSLKEIEGHYGSGVATYFKFFRWLFILNSIVFTVSFSFVVIPQIMYRFMGSPNNNGTETEYNSTVAGLVEYISLDRFSPLTELPNSTSSFLVTALPLTTEGSSDQGVPRSFSPYSSNSEFAFGNIFTGEGFFTNTSLYYGYYTNKSLETISGLYYSIPMAYFFTAVCCYLFIFLSLSVSMAKSYRKSFIETTGGLKNMYAHKVFCGWDFSIATGEAAHLKSKSIFNEIRELLSEDSNYEEERSCMVNFYIFAVRLAVNVLSLVILVGTGTVMWLMLNANLGPDSESDHRISMMMSLIVTLIVMASPVLFSRLAKFEEYHNPRTALYVILFRTFGLEVVIIGVLVTFWLQRTQTSTTCWETSLGQEVYRLILMDFFIAVVATSLAEFVRKRIYETLWKPIGAPEFDIARNTLNLVYNQTLFFVGFFFSPLLSFIIVIKMFIQFYITKIRVLKNCQPSIRSWRAAQTQTVFLVLSFLSLLGVIITYGYILTQVETSNCGPFRGHPTMYQMILEGLFQLKQDHDYVKVIMFVTKPGVVAGILISMCVGVYYLRAQSHAQVRMVNILREMLLLEAKDKEFLISISKATDATWLYKIRPGGHHTHVPKSRTSLRHYDEQRLQSGDQPRRNDSPSFEDSPDLALKCGDSTTGGLSTDSSQSYIGEAARSYYKGLNNISSTSMLPSSSSDELLPSDGHSGTSLHVAESEPHAGRIRKLRRF